MIKRVNLADSFALIQECWAPKIIGELNDQQVKLARLSGEFIWHQHDTEDELFLVVRGKLLIRTREGEVVLGPGDLTIVPRGTQHQPVAIEDTEVMLFEPKSTINTGEVLSERTRAAEPLTWRGA